MKHRTLLAAGTALLAFNIGTAYAGQAPAPVSDRVLLAQEDPAEMTPEELRKKKRREQRQEQQETAPTAPAAPAAEEPRKTKKQLRREERQERQEQRQEQRAKQAPAERQAKPAEEQPAKRKPARAEEPAKPAPEPRKAEKQRPADTPAEKPARKPVEEKPANDTAQTPPKPAEKPVRRTEEPGGKPPRVTNEQPSTPARPAEGESPRRERTETPVRTNETTIDTSKTPVMVTTPPELRKPRAERDRDTATREERRERRAERRDERRTERPRIEEPVRPVTEERGERVDPREARTERRPDEDNVRDRRKFGDRTVLRLGDGRLVVELNPERDSRLRRQYRNVETYRLPGGRLREVVTRPDGSQIVTVYNRYGDILRRSRILPNGREIVLFYVPRDRWDRIPGWDRDPGYDLPPIVVNVPYDDYIWEPQGASADDYYDFLYQPPVEAAERLYSVDEVRRSARLRQKLPRVDLSTVTFAFGSAEIRDGDVEKLQSLAEAMNRMLKENPSESFLIEGHTDAVGSDEANLALSDRRAEAVAIALTDVFGLPAENLVTQGYGESDLKVQTEAPSEENRRVTVRRITPLVTSPDAQVSQR
ncbi:MAG: OmpA family protein [Notoacmeibacter sp.]|nr:OmpA family protein [Notoacmeibacter sp.]